MKHVIRFGDSELISTTVEAVSLEALFESRPKWGRRLYWSDGTETYVVHESMEESIRYMRSLEGE